MTERAVKGVENAAIWSRISAWSSARYRGALICVLGGIAAIWLSEHYGAPAMLLALLLGLAVNFLREDAAIIRGIDWVAKDVLRVGVALLGIRISAQDIMAGGSTGPLIVLGAMAATFVLGAISARILGLTPAFGRLSAGSVAICGVSAAIAISAVLPKRKGNDEELAMVLISVTALSTIAMILYPLVSSALAFDDTMAGVFIGGSIHDVAQVVGAGYSISGEAGDTATYIKLMRVAMLLPIVLLIGLTMRGGRGSTSEKPALVPGFLIVFVALAAVNSLGWVAADVAAWGSDISRAFLVVAIFAIGARSCLKELVQVGPKPFILVFMQTLVMAGVVAAGLLVT